MSKEKGSMPTREEQEKQEILQQRKERKAKPSGTAQEDRLNQEPDKQAVDLASEREILARSVERRGFDVPNIIKLYAPKAETKEEKNDAIVKFLYDQEAILRQDLVKSYLEENQEVLKAYNNKTGTKDKSLTGAPNSQDKKTVASFNTSVEPSGISTDEKNKKLKQLASGARKELSKFSSDKQADHSARSTSTGKGTNTIKR